MPARQVTPPMSPQSTPPLVLCADGGGSKVCVVIRSADGLEVRGVAGPCNVQSVGHGPAIQAILLATYRALAQLPPTHLPDGLHLPALTVEDSPPPANAVNGSAGSTPSRLLMPSPLIPSAASLRSVPASPFGSRPGSPKVPPMPSLNLPLFQYVWLGLAGISSISDVVAFMPTVLRGLNTSEERVKITNDVNLLAAPALRLQGIKHVAAVVCGTGTVGRTIEIAETPMPDAGSTGVVRQLPLADVGVSKGWGWLLCDEGSAFWIGRLAIRSLLYHIDRCTRSSLYSGCSPTLLPFHHDLLAYFGVSDPMDLIGIVSLIGPSAEDLSIGEATAKRNAYMAGAARTVLRWAFPDDASPPSPPSSIGSSQGDGVDGYVESTEIARSRKEALKIVHKAITPMVDLTIDLLGDLSVVRPETTALALGGGLWQSKGYRTLLVDGLRKEGVEFAQVVVVDDAAGVGASGLASVEFGH